MSTRPDTPKTVPLALPADILPLMIRVSRFRRRAYPGPIGPRLRDFLQTIRKEGDDMVLEMFVGKIVRIVDTYSPLNFI